MRKAFWLSVIAIAVGVSACNHDAAPTGSEQDLLKNPANAPALDGSKFGQALATDSDADAEETIIDPIPAYEANPDSTAGSVHIKDTHNRSKYKPAGYEHISTGGNMTKYKPAGWNHYNGSQTVDKTKYLPPKSYHIPSGVNETRYKTTTVIDAEPVPVTP